MINKSFRVSSWKMAMSPDLMRFHELLGGLHLSVSSSATAETAEWPGWSSWCWRRQKVHPKVSPCCTIFTQSTWLCGCCLMLFVFVDSYWHRNRNFSPNSEQKNAKSEELNWRIWTSAAEWAQPLGELLAIFFWLPLALSPAQLPMSRLLRILLVAVTWSMGRWWEYTKDTHHTPLKTYEKD